MGYKIAPVIQASFDNGDAVEFRVLFSPEVVLNNLAIKRQGVVIATDANVYDETYRLPAGAYVASLRFWADAGTKGSLEIQAPTGKRERSATITEGHIRETISLSFQL